MTAYNLSRSAWRVQKFLDVLAAAKKPLERRELAARLHVDVRTVNVYVKHLRAKKLIYVATWPLDEYNRPIRGYACGDLPDVAKPRPPSAARRARRYRARLRAERPEVHLETVLAKRAARQRRAPARRSGLDTAFYGDI